MFSEQTRRPGVHREQARSHIEAGHASGYKDKALVLAIVISPAVIVAAVIGIPVPVMAMVTAVIIAAVSIVTAAIIPIVIVMVVASRGHQDRSYQGKP